MSAMFAGITSILIKCGIKRTSPLIATAIRTTVVLFCAVGMTLIAGSLAQIGGILPKTWIFLALSGIATCASWLCYAKAIKIGDISKVVPIDKSSTIITQVLALILLLDVLTMGKAIGTAVMAVGIMLMTLKKPPTEKPLPADKNGGIVLAVLSAVFASFTAIFGKIGIDGVETNLGTALRTAFVATLIWCAVLPNEDRRKELKSVSKTEFAFIVLSGFATGGSWLCYFAALQSGNVTAVVAIDKLSILPTILFSVIVFKEKLSLKEWIGLGLVVCGALTITFAVV